MDHRPLCQALRRDGSPCRAPALPSGLCLHHDPGHAQAQAQSLPQGPSQTKADRIVIVGKQNPWRGIIECHWH